MAPITQNRYFDPEGLARVGNMELIARQVVEGFLSGRHRSPYQGFSVEYLDHRSYCPGDEIRTLDWKVLARTDKYYVKLFEEETNLRAYILLDCSRSMGFKTGEITKLDYGGYLAAALTHLMLHQNDAVGLVTFDTQVREFLPPKAHPSQFRRVLDSLVKVKQGEETDLGTVLNQVAERLRRRGLIVLISDLIDDESRIANGLQHFRHDKHEVIVLHVMDNGELTFPFERMSYFKDMEGAGRVVANPARIRARYLERIKQFTERVREDCHRRKISYALADTKQPYDRFLAAYLDKRSRLG